MQARFHLCLHAYLLEPADTTPIVIDDPQWAGRELMTPDHPDDPASPVTIRREGMAAFFQGKDSDRSEEHTSELQSLMRISYAVFCLKTIKKTKYTRQTQ